MKHGFNTFPGAPYSNDMAPFPLIRDRSVIENTAEQTEADRPFFIYLADTFAHIPLFTSQDFRRRSAGRQGRKGGADDGACRVCFIAHGPGAGQGGSDAMAMNIGLPPTIAAMTGASLRDDRVIHGRDISSLLQGGQESPRPVWMFFENDRIAVLRTERWRLGVRAYYKSFLMPLEQFGAVLLLDLAACGEERYRMSKDEPGVVAEMVATLQSLRAVLEAPPREQPAFPHSDGAPIQTFAQTLADLE